MTVTVKATATAMFMTRKAYSHIAYRIMQSAKHDYDATMRILRNGTDGSLDYIRVSY